MYTFQQLLSSLAQNEFYFVIFDIISTFFHSHPYLKNQTKQNVKKICFHICNL